MYICHQNNNECWTLRSATVNWEGEGDEKYENNTCLACISGHVGGMAH